MRWITTLVAMCVAVCVSASAMAQDPDPRYTLYIDVDRPIVEPGETATLLVRAGFDSGVDYSMHLILTDLVSSLGSVGLRSQLLTYEMRYHCALPPYPRYCSAGEASDRGIDGILAGQIQFSGGGGIYSYPFDPINFWTAEFVAPADVVEPTEVALSTATTLYQVYGNRDTSVPTERVDQLTEGSATITIVPCRADINGDGVADLFDFLAFTSAFDAGEAIAEFDFDGELTVFDFLEFQNRFDAGC